MRFSQHSVVNAVDEDARALPPGLLGLLRFRAKPGKYVIQVDFDPWDSAERSNATSETQASTERLLLIDGEPKDEYLDMILDPASQRN